MLLLKWMNLITFAKRKPAAKKPRAYMRTEYRNLVRYQADNETTPHLLSNLVDISEGGLQLSMTRKVKVGTLLNMIINLVEKNQDVPVLGKVVWVKPIPGYRGGYRVGVVFEEITPHDKAVLRDLVMAPSFISRKH